MKTRKAIEQLVNMHFFSIVLVVLVLSFFLLNSNSFSQETVCNDGIDNDVDGFIDCIVGIEDPDCPCQAEDTLCMDGVDNDGDGDIDCDDSDCAGSPECIDSDSDTIPDIIDNCPLDPNADQMDADFDGIGDDCDICPSTFNPDQMDADRDGIGDDCDNCPLDPNVDQMDADNDGIGDVCDDEPDDEVVIPTQIPTLSEWGLIAMAGLLGIVGLLVMRRRKVTA